MKPGELKYVYFATGEVKTNQIVFEGMKLNCQNAKYDVFVKNKIFKDGRIQIDKIIIKFDRVKQELPSWLQEYWKNKVNKTYGDKDYEKPKL